MIGDDSNAWLVMMGHLQVPGLTKGKTPASLDPAAYRLLREDIGHKGLVITDEISGMVAVSRIYTPQEAIVAALGAGADLVLVAEPGDLGALIQSIAQEVREGRLSEARVSEAAAHVATTKFCAWQLVTDAERR